MRWLLLDKILEIEKGRLARAVSRLPDVPVSHEILLTEMMAQTAGLLLGAEFDYSKDVVLAKIEKVSYARQCGWEAGRRVEITARPEQFRDEGAWFEAFVKMDEQIIAESNLLLVTAGALRPDLPGTVTFPSAFMEHFRIRECVSPQAGRGRIC